MEIFVSLIMLLMGIMMAKISAFGLAGKYRVAITANSLTGLPQFLINRRGAVPIFLWVAIALSMLVLAAAKSFEISCSPLVQIFSGTSGLAIAIIVVAIIAGAIFYQTRQNQ